VDPLNRIFAISYNTNGMTDVLASPTVDYVYLSTGAVSRLKSVTTQGVSTVEFDFDTYARIKETKTTLLSRPANPMIVNYTYDTLGRIADVVYPTPHGISGAARKTVHADYDIAGRINSVKVNDVAYASDFVFNSSNKLTSIKIGPSGTNQINETYDYNLQTGLLQNQKVLRAGTALLDLSYVYQQCSCSTGGSGQIEQITNNLDRNKDRQYDYDAIGRLKKVIGGINQTWSQTYTYDRFGNRTGVASTGFEALRNPSAQVARSGEQDKILAETLQNSAPPTSSQLLEDVKALSKPGNSREAESSPISLYKESERKQSSRESNTTTQQATIQPGESEGESASFNPPPNRTPFDFDGDHHADFSVWQRSNGNWTVLQSGNNQYRYEQFGASGDQIAPADYDGDGKTDIAVWRPSNGTWYFVRSSDNVFVSVQWGALGDAIVPADYDGDGKADFAIWRPGTSYWYVLRSTDGGYSATPFGGQQYGDIPVAADYDGDGKADIAVWRPSNGAWYYIRSSDSQVVYPAHGMSGDVPVKADYDGDGKTDLAVWRPSNNFWYILRSSDNVSVSTNWGTTGDVTVPADYDGDNHADIAVFRPSTGMWYVLRTTDGGVTSQQLGSSGHVAVPSAYIRRSSAPKGQSVVIPRDGMASVSYDTTSNRLTTSGFTYDYAGNQTRIVREDGTVLRFQYDAAGRLAKVKNDSNQTIATYTYGISRERLITQEGDENSTNRTYYAWDGGAVIAEYIDSAQNTLLWTRNYIYMRGALLATQEQTPGGEKVQFDHPDQLGTRIITESGTTTSFEQTTLPFGTVLNSESTGATNYRFTSYDRGASTNLDYAVNRFYDSTQGRFTQVDPIKMNSASLLNPQSLNLYAYCTNDPVNHTDPQGLNGWGFYTSWPPWGYPPPSGGTTGASFWAWLSSFLHGFTGNVFNFGIPGYYLPPALQQTFVSLSETYGLPQTGTTNQIVARQPSQAEIDFVAASRVVGTILSQNNGINRCNQFFNGAGMGALESITNMVNNSNGQAFQGIAGNSSTGIRMRAPTLMNMQDAPIMPEDGRYVAVAPMAIIINMNGSFVLHLPNGRGNGPLPYFGGYPPGSLQSRVLQLLHEMGHLTITGLGLTRTTFNYGGRRRTFLMRSLIPLLPLDGQPGQEGLSSTNTETVLNRCGDQIDALLPR
jgi:RHS repeat-associated protein